MTKEKDSTVESNTESRRFQPSENLRIPTTEHPDFFLVHEELIELLKYWVGEKLEVLYWDLIGAGAGRAEVRILQLSRMRIDQILELLPEEVAEAAMDEAEAKCKKDCGFSDEDWDIFRNGTSQQWLELREKIWAKVEGNKINQT